MHKMYILFIVYLPFKISMGHNPIHPTFKSSCIEIHRGGNKYSDYSNKPDRSGFKYFSKSLKNFRNKTEERSDFYLICALI